MSLKSKIEAVIYASEEPVTLAQLIVLLSEEVQSELDALSARQSELPLEGLGELSQEVAESADQSAAGGVEDALALAEVPATTAVSEGDAGIDSEMIDRGAAPEIHSETPKLVADSPEIATPEPVVTPGSEAERRRARERERAIREYLRTVLDTLMRDYAEADRGLEIREVAGGFRFGTKPEYHDAVRGFVKSLKPALKLTLQALETLAVVAYKQPVTAAEISEIRGVDSSGVLGGLLTRKLIQTAGRKQVIGRPMLYKTTREFLVRFGLRDVQELPSMEEFERMAGELAEQEDLPMEATSQVIERANARGDAEHIREANETAPVQGETASPAEEAGRPPASAVHGDGHASAPEPETSDAVAEQPGMDASPRAEVEPAAQDRA